MTVLSDKSLERYELLERIAVGGMAEVFRAKATGAHGFEKTLAIKRILPELARDPEFVARFIGEAKLAVKLTHANVVQVFDFGRFGGTLFIAMEYIDGLDLAALLKAHRERADMVPVTAAFQIAIEICRGLDFAHRHNVVHRDVSPSNILLSLAGEVKIADFGIAQAASANNPVRRPSSRRRVMGKWRYMSPEQTRGEDLSTSSDLFSAAVVIYELFTGDKLFPGDEAEDIIENIHNMELPLASQKRPGIPRSLDGFLARALCRDPAGRPARAAEMLRELTEISYESSIVATALDVAETVERISDRNQRPATDRMGLDALIRGQLGVAPKETTRRTAVSTDVAEPAPGSADESARAVSEQASSRTGATTQTSTMVRRGIDRDGVTIWDVETSGENTIAASPSALRVGKATGSVGVVEDAVSAGGEDGAAAGSRSRARVAAYAAAALTACAGAVAVWLGAAPEPVARSAEVISDAGARTSGPVADGYLSVDSQPPGAVVWLDGDRHDSVTPTLLIVDVDHYHRVELQLDGHQSYVRDQIRVAPGQTFEVVGALPALVAMLRVNSNPPGAQVSLGGAVIGRTPLDRRDLKPGRGLTLTITKPGYKPITALVDLNELKPAFADHKLTANVRYGTIKLQIDHGWAEVYLGKKKVGQAPARALRLPLGKHRLRLYNPESRKEKYFEVDVVADKVRYFRTAL